MSLCIYVCSIHRVNHTQNYTKILFFTVILFFPLYNVNMILIELLKCEKASTQPDPYAAKFLISFLVTHLPNTVRCESRVQSDAVL